MSNEPVLVSVALGNLVGVVINLLLAWGVSIPQDRQDAITAGVQVVCTIVGAIVARRLVWTAQSVDDATELAVTIQKSKDAWSND